MCDHVPPTEVPHDVLLVGQPVDQNLLVEADEPCVKIWTLLVLHVSVDLTLQLILTGVIIGSNHDDPQG